jgi:hypothetical protein
MTTHYPSGWSITDPIDSKFMEDIADAVVMNIRIDSSCFAILNDGDNLIFILQRLWQNFGDDPERFQKELTFTASTCPAPATIVSVGEFVYAKLREEFPNNKIGENNE